MAWVTARFRLGCEVCGSRDFLLVPMKRPRERKRRKKTWTDEVAGFFHSMRAAAKQRRRKR